MTRLMSMIQRLINIAVYLGITIAVGWTWQAASAEQRHGLFWTVFVVAFGLGVASHYRYYRLFKKVKANSSIIRKTCDDIEKL